MKRREFVRKATAATAAIAAGVRISLPGESVPTTIEDWYAQIRAEGLSELEHRYVHGTGELNPVGLVGSGEFP